MSDRELLEAAAKAAGIDIHWNAMVNAERHPIVNYYNAYQYEEWNPLEDDGDALRLLNRLPYRTLYVSEIGATVSWQREDGSGHGWKCDEYAAEHGGDLSAATRRAITRAAAEIGADMLRREGGR